MRTIVESTLVSADGVIGDPPQWAMGYRDEEVQAEALDRLSGSDAMLMGRVTYELFAATWPAQAGDFADRMNSIRKYVFSSTLERADWSNSTIVRGDAVTEVTKLKQQDGGDLLILGHGLLGETLLKQRLLDVLDLDIYPVLTYPVLAGRGKPFFREGQAVKLKLATTKSFSKIVKVTYEPQY